MNQYSTPVSKQIFELEIKRSRFITTVIPTVGRNEALQRIGEVRESMPDANHHCWAMVAGTPADHRGQDQSDDGEPRGTAGKPMLNVLTHSGLGNLVVVVTRYFGGIKLGSGGLVRAYSRSVSTALDQLELTTTYIRSEHQLDLPYSSLGQLEHWLQQTNISINDKVFSEKVELSVLVPEDELSALADRLMELGGRIVKNS